ncbi:MAG: bifunctional phosphoribosylaminoimidazolecarboxamide formyltransferase/IMP cyclohydrolase [Myxococcota bacterium]
MADRHALLSTSDKSGLVPFARTLASAGYTLLSTGGTARALREAGLAVVDVSAYTGAPEMMDGRVKTLHPRVHGGILGLRDRHAAEAAAHDIPWIDVVVVNLYPFEATVAAGAATPDALWDEAIEHIDVGGPTMIRAAAKNHRDVTVVVDPADYDRVGAALASGGTGLDLRRELAIRAFRHTARYDAVISGWLGDHAGAALDRSGPEFPGELALPLSKVQDLRYGENPHQRAAFYGDGGLGARSLARLIQHQGKELSFNNLADLDAAVRAVFDLPSGPGCVVVKHNNPCGAAIGATAEAAFTHALAGDPVSAYGGIVAFDRPIDGPLAAAIKRSKTFFEVIVAPGFDDAARAAFASRENLRLVELPAGWGAGRPSGMDARRVQGGWLLQDWDLGAAPGWTVATDRAPTDAEAVALRFAWAVCRNVKSNAITLAAATDDGAALNGVGAGQMSRVDSVRLAVGKATRPVAGCVLASDAFFPFADGVEVAVAAGVTAVIQPGGSIRDPEVVAVANQAGVAMVFTGVRHFRH